MPRPQVTRGDEMPAGTRAPAVPAPARDDAGKLLPGPGTSEQARRAAEARWRRHRLAQSMADQLGLDVVPEHFQPFVDAALARRDQVIGDLIQNVGGGEIGPVVESFLDDATLLWAMSRFWGARGAAGDLDATREARMCTLTARGHLTMARDVAAKDAEARRSRPMTPAALAKLIELGKAPAQPKGQTDG